MATYSKPGVYIEERLLSNSGVTTAASAALFVGATNSGPTADPERIESWSDYVLKFGAFDKVEDENDPANTLMTYLPYAVYQYFQNGGRPAYVQRVVGDTAGTKSNIVIASMKAEPDDVTDVEWSGNVATITTAANHGYVVGDRVTVAMDTVTAFDGTFVITDVPTADTFTYDLDLESAEALGGTNEVQRLTQNTATAGTYTLTFGTDTTDAIAYNAQASTVEAALEALDSIGVGNVSVSRSGTAGNYIYDITFDNEHLADKNVAALVVDNTNLTAVSNAVSTPTPGASYTATTDGTVNGPDHTAPAFTLESKSVGKASNFVFAADATDTDSGLAVTVEQDAYVESLYTITIYKDGSVVERFGNLSTADQPGEGLKNVESRINDLRIGSQYVKVIDFVPGRSPILVDYPTAGESTDTPFTTHYPWSGAFGRDLADPGYGDEVAGSNPSLPSEAELVAAAQSAVSKIANPLVVNIPGYVNALGDYVSGLVSSSSFPTRSDIFIINDYAPQRLDSETSASYIATAQGVSSLGAFTNDSYVAAYTPWIITPDPKQTGGTVIVPPGGSVAGVMSRVDSTIGVFRAPAGVAVAGINNAIGVDTNFTDSQLGALNDANINVIRPVAGQGINIMGARTKKRYGADRYVSARRTLIYIAETLRRSSQFALFENNSETLWSNLRFTSESFLRSLWEQGGLRGTSADEAFYVKCDASINPPSQISEGELRMEVGVSIEQPAEFIVITITQREQGGSTISVSNLV